VRSSLPRAAGGLVLLGALLSPLLIPSAATAAAAPRTAAAAPRSFP